MIVQIEVATRPDRIEYVRNKFSSVHPSIIAGAAHLWAGQSGQAPSVGSSTKRRLRTTSTCGNVEICSRVAEEIRAETAALLHPVQVYFFVVLTVEDVSGYCEGSSARPLQQQTRVGCTGKGVNTTKDYTSTVVEGP